MFANFYTVPFFQMPIHVCVPDYRLTYEPNSNTAVLHNQLLGIRPNVMVNRSCAVNAIWRIFIKRGKVSVRP